MSMIRKFGYLEAEPHRVRGLFAVIEAWPSWMPGVRSARVLARSGSSLTAELEQVSFGHVFRATLEVSLGERSLRLRQLSGWFRRWEAAWRFLAAPGRSGTTLGLELDFELRGILGWLNPAGIVQDRLDRLFAELVSAASHRLAASASASEPGRSQVLLRLLRTRRGLEVEIAGKRLLLPLRLA
jgi:ribosome-associated toxin RatA of RatAB toxin-antitoxin module